MKRLIIPVLLILPLIITTCSAALPSLPSQPQADPVSSESSSPELLSATRMDDQGAIIFEVTPLNLDQSIESLEFNIVLKTIFSPKKQSVWSYN